MVCFLSYEKALHLEYFEIELHRIANLWVMHAKGR